MLDFFREIVGERFQDAALMVGHFARPNVEQTKRAYWKAADSAHGCAGIEAEAARFDEGIVGETAIAREIFHHKGVVFRYHVTANGHGARRATLARQVFRQPNLRLEPLPVAIDKGDKRDWHLEKFRQLGRDTIENALRFAIEPLAIAGVDRAATTVDECNRLASPSSSRSRRNFVPPAGRS